MYKTILVHVDETPRSAQRVEIASHLAGKFEAHLVGAAMTGLSAFMFPSASIDAGMPPIVFPIELLQAEANRALDVFDQVASSVGVNSFERRMVDDEAGYAMSMHARYSDLVVIGQAAPNEFLPRLRSDFPEYVLLNCTRPVLVLPRSGTSADIGRSVTVAWNGSAEAVRAITSAIPLLKQAGRVDLVVFNADGEPDVHGDDPGADMALFLARHGIKVNVIAAKSGRDDGDALLSFAADSGADLIVMGAYGHSRFREFLLGGMTRTALSSSPVPLWMAH
jgi:nucleotide-binding universal stress UspA family protein